MFNHDDADELSRDLVSADRFQVSSLLCMWVHCFVIRAPLTAFSHRSCKSIMLITSMLGKIVRHLQSYERDHKPLLECISSALDDT